MFNKKQLLLLGLLLILLDTINKAIHKSKLGKAMYRVLENRLDTAEKTFNPINILNKKLNYEEMNNLRLIYENGRKAEVYGNQHYIEIDKEFTILTYKNVTGKLMSYNINGQTMFEDIKKELLYNSFDIFGPVIFNTSINNKIDLEISSYIFPSFKNSEGIDINTINLTDNDTDIFYNLLCNGTISRIKSETLHIIGLKHYSDELMHLQMEKRKKMPLIKRLIFW